MNTVAKLDKNDISIIQKEANLEKVADFCNIFNMIRIYRDVPRKIPCYSMVI